MSDGVIGTVALATEAQIKKLLDTGVTYDGWMTYLQNVRPRYVGTPMLAQIDATLARGDQTRSSIVGIVQRAQDVWNWLSTEATGAWDALKSSVGLSGLEIPAGMLAVIGALGATAVLGATYAMVQWVNGDAAITKQNLDQYDRDYQRLLDAGLKPADALQKANDLLNQRTKATGEADATKNKGNVSFLDQLMDKGSTLLMWTVGGYIVYRFAKSQKWI